MRAMAVSVFCISIILWTPFGFCDSRGEQPDVIFASPFACTSPDECSGLSLVGSFKAGLNAVLVGERGFFWAKTADTCICSHSDESRIVRRYPDDSLKVTRLVKTEKCFAEGAEQRRLKRFSIAIVSADPTAVRLIPTEDNLSPLPKGIELKARQLARAEFDPCQSLKYQSIDEFSLAKVVRAGDATLLRFQHPEKWGPDNGPMILFIKNNVFRLCGACTSSPLFFAVNDKIYLVYEAFHCCTCSLVRSNSCVYDLSNEMPEKVYWGSSRGPEEKVFRSFMPH